LFYTRLAFVLLLTLLTKVICKWLTAFHAGADLVSAVHSWLEWYLYDRQIHDGHCTNLDPEKNGRRKRYTFL